jgi:hypothetical protein
MLYCINDFLGGGSEVSSFDKAAGTVSFSDKFSDIDVREEIERQLQESIGATGGFPIRRKERATTMRLRSDLPIVLLILILSIALIQVAQAQPASQSSQWDLAEYPLALFAAISAVILAGAGILLFLAARKPNDPFIFKLRPSFFFWLGMAYATLLMLLAIAYNVSYKPSGPYLLGSMLPIAVPWFGALGAVTISLEGVFHWSESQWNPEYNYWHLGRPVFGAILGTIGFFLFVLIVMTSGTTPQFLQDPSKATPAKDFIIYYVVAFLAGYREETFRELIRRVTDMILKPAPQAVSVPQVSFRTAGVTQSEIRFAGTAVGSTDRMTLDILNSGDASLLAPTLAMKAADPTPHGVFGLDNDHLTGTPELGPGEIKTVDITFHPLSAGTYSGVLSVAAKNLTNPAAIRVIGSTQ